MFWDQNQLSSIVQRPDRHNSVSSKPSKRNIKNFMNLIKKGKNFNLTNENDCNTEKEWHDRKTLNYETRWVIDLMYQIKWIFMITFSNKVVDRLTL